MSIYDPPSGGTWRFNPPPGWSAPSADWTPPPHWEPDPAWPPMPQGWPLWIPVGYAAATASPPLPDAPDDRPAPESVTAHSESGAGQPVHRRVRAGVVRAVKVLAAAISLVATAVATWVALADRPEAYGVDEWRQSANATCERDFSSIVPLFAKAYGTQLAAATGRFDSDDPELATVGNTMAEVAAATGRTAGDLRAIKVPEDVVRSDVDKLLGAISDWAASAAAMSGALLEFHRGSADLIDTSKKFQQAVDNQTAAGKVWNETAISLGLDKCAVFPAPAPSASPSPPILGPEERALYQHIKQGAIIQCIATRGQLEPGAIAHLVCTPPKSGPAPDSVHVIQFRDHKAMLDWYTPQTTGLHKGDCGTEDATGKWGPSGGTTPLGANLCRAVGTGYTMVWTYDSLNIAVVTQMRERSAVNGWWLKAGDIVA